MSEHIIFHCDVNSAFLSWSAVKRLKEDPDAVDLRTIPSAVGGDVETRHGVITAKSIPAKKYGVTTGEPVVKALQKCPNLVLVPSDWETYREYSHAFMKILHEYSAEIEQASIDEAYVDMTEAVEKELQNIHAAGKEIGNGRSRWWTDDGTNEAATCIAARIRSEVRKKLSFTINIGISSNKLLAKMASDFEKPDKTHTLWPEEVPTKMWPLPIGSLYGCGRKTADRLSDLGIRTIGDAAAADPKVLQSFLGEKGGAYISQASRGIGSVSVQTTPDEAKSYSNELTTAEDITQANYRELMPPLIGRLSASVSRRLQRDGVYGSTVTVSVKTDDFRRHSRQTRLLGSTNEKDIIEKNAANLMENLLFEKGGIYDRGAGIRLVGVGVSTLDHGEYRQMDLAGFLREQSREQERRQQEQQERNARIREKERKRQEQEEEEKRIQEEQQKALAEQERQDRLEDMLQKLQKKYGSSKIHKGITN